MDKKISHRLPTPKEYNELRRLAQWTTFSETIVKEALANSLFGVVIHDEQGQILGMGRVLGDNAIYLHVQDVIVRPACQKMGIGKLLMHELLGYVKKVAGQNTNVGLMSSKTKAILMKLTIADNALIVPNQILRLAVSFFPPLL